MLYRREIQRFVIRENQHSHKKKSKNLLKAVHQTLQHFKKFKSKSSNKEFKSKFNRIEENERDCVSIVLSMLVVATQANELHSVRGARDLVISRGSSYCYEAYVQIRHSNTHIHTHTHTISLTHTYTLSLFLSLYLSLSFFENLSRRFSVLTSYDLALSLATQT